MSPTLVPRESHVLVRRDQTSTIIGATVGCAVAVMLIVVCSLPFILKCRRKKRLRKRQEQDALNARMDLDMAINMPVSLPGTRPSSQTFSAHPRHSHASQSRLASAAATLSDHDSQTGKEYGPDGITYHRSAAPSPALVGKTLRSCSPAPSIALAASAASRKNSPALAQAPFSPPSERQIQEEDRKEDIKVAPTRTPTFGTLTSEPEPMSRSTTTGSQQHGSHSPISGAIHKIHNKIFHRNSTRSSGSESRKTGSRSPDLNYDYEQLGQTQTGASSAQYVVNEEPPMGGLAAEYYSGAPLSPPEEPHRPTAGPDDSKFISLAAFSGAAMAGVAAPHSQQAATQPQQQQQHHLGSPFVAPGAPLSPTSPLIKDEDLSSEEGARESLEAAKSDTLSPPPRGLQSSSPKPPPSPSHPAPGTVNPMDMMKPSNDVEQAAWVDNELWKLENSPPPQVYNSSPSPTTPQTQLESSPVPPLQQSQQYQQYQQYQSIPPSQTEHFASPPFYPGTSFAAVTPTAPAPAPATGRPQFQAVVRHPTQMDITVDGQAVPQHEEQVITDISDTSSPGPGFDQYAYGPSPSDHAGTSPETRLTESAYTGSPSPRSSMSNRPSSLYGGTGKVASQTLAIGIV